MRARILDFVQALRARDVDVSVAETLDAVEAVAAAGVEREVLREALAAALVKDEADRPAFDALFEERFPLGGAADAPAGRRRRGQRSGGGQGGATGRGTRGGTGTASDSSTAQKPVTPRPVPAGPASDRKVEARGERADPAPREHDHGASDARPTSGARRAARRRELLARPFRELVAGDLDEARDLAHALGHRLR